MAHHVRSTSLAKRCLWAASSSTHPHGTTRSSYPPSTIHPVPTDAPNAPSGLQVTFSWDLSAILTLAISFVTRRIANSGTPNYGGGDGVAQIQVSSIDPAMYRHGPL
jgi:hypothetical protein